MRATLPRWRDPTSLADQRKMAGDGAPRPDGPQRRALAAAEIGGAIVDLLAGTGEYDITVADCDATFLNIIDPQWANKVRADFGDAAAPAGVTRGMAAPISALPFALFLGCRKRSSGASPHCRPEKLLH